MIKVVLLKNGGLNDYLIGVVEELDEEPSLFIQDCVAKKLDIGVETHSAGGLAGTVDSYSSTIVALGSTIVKIDSDVKNKSRCPEYFG